MRSRKEQLQAYQFLRRRIGAAMVSGEPDTLDPPMRRVIRTSFAGVMVGAIVVAIFGLYGVFRPGGAEGWKDSDGSLVVEKETGAAYAYSEGELHPMLNYASARLFLGQGDAEPRRVSRGSLEGTPRTQEKGIADAPHSLPDPNDLVVAPWSVCADPNSPDAAAVSLLAGDAPESGALAANEALVVTAGNQTYLVWRNKRYLVPDDSILFPLGLQETAAQEVGVAWLNALPAGPELEFPTIPQLGQDGPSLPNGSSSRIGEIFVVDYGDRQTHVLRMPDGLAPIPESVAQIIRASPQVQDEFGSLNFQPLLPATFAQAETTDPPGDLATYPEGITQAANVDRARRGVLCVTMTGTGGGNPTPVVSAVPEVPQEGRPVTAPPGPATPTADAFYIEAGRGAVVGAVPHPNMPSAVQPSSRFLITDRGIKYPINTSDGSLEALGYAEAEIARLPVSMIQMLPSGPSLSRQAATEAATGDDVQQAPSAGQGTGGQGTGGQGSGGDGSGGPGPGSQGSGGPGS